MSDGWELLPPAEPELPELRGYKIYSARILNVSSSLRQWQNMGNAALAAMKSLKQAGETNFNVKVEAGTGPNLQEIAANAYRDFMCEALRCVQERKPVANLTEGEKFAICVACKVPLTTERSDSMVMVTKTAVRCGIVWDDEVNSYHVYQMAE